MSGSAAISLGANDSADLTISGIVADVNATLASLLYTPNLNITGIAADVLTVTTDDGGIFGGGALQDVDSVQINVTNVNDEETLTTNTGLMTSDVSEGIAINPVNDNDPVITSDGAGASAAISVVENSTAVTTVTASDSDLPAQTLSYNIVGGSDAGRFNIGSGSGILMFAAARDFESPADSNVDNVYEVVVEVSDGLGRTDQQTIQVTVIDVDEFDVTPILDLDVNPNQVNENEAPGTILGLTAFSNDLDGTNNTVTYTLDDDAGGLFQIDGLTGVVSTTAPIDFEVSGGTLNIIARGTSADASTTARGFSITVNDLNEFDPVVNDQSFSVSENSANGTSVGTVVASDGDTAQTLTYVIISGNTNGTFIIGSASGDITVNNQNELGDRRAKRTHFGGQIGV